MSDSVQPHRRQSTRLPRPWDSPGKNTGVGCHCLLPQYIVLDTNPLERTWAVLCLAFWRHVWWHDGIELSWDWVQEIKKYFKEWFLITPQWFSMLIQCCSVWKMLSQDISNLMCFQPVKKEMATHSSVLAWRIPGTGEPGGLLSMGSHRVGHDRSDLAAAVAATCSSSVICSVVSDSLQLRGL